MPPGLVLLVFDASGNLYGTTGNGGPVNAACGGYGTDIPAGCGVVFQLAPPASGTTWTENVLYSFTGGADGAQPGAGVIFDTKGNLYGTVTTGGGFGYGARPDRRLSIGL